MGPGSDVFDYAVDADDVIVAVGEGWLRFARENGASELSRDAVVGSCLWQHVAGEPTRELYEMLFRRVRGGRRAVVLPFRCDSPDRFRFMELEILPREGADLGLRGRLIRDQARPNLRLFDRLVEHSPEPLAACSVCLRLQILGTTWVEAEEAVERLDLFGAPWVPTLDYRVCEDCVALVQRLGRDAAGSAA